MIANSLNDLNRNKLTAGMTLAEIMDVYSRMTVEEFLGDAEASFDERFNEWRVRHFKYDSYHYFKKYSGIEESEVALREAYDHLQVIAAHEGEVNIHGVFLNPERVEIVNTKKADCFLKMGYSKPLDEWFFGFDWNLKSGGYSGCGSPASLTYYSDIHYYTKTDAVVSACNQILDYSPDEVKTAVARYLALTVSREADIQLPPALMQGIGEIQLSLF